MTDTQELVRRLEAGEVEFFGQIPGYGRFQFTAQTRQLAENMVNRKRQWEGATSCLTWRADCATKFDSLTKRIADLFLEGKGAPRSLMVRRAKAMAALLKAEG